MLGGAATIYPSNYWGIYLGVTYGIAIDKNAKSFSGWIGKVDGNITDTTYSTTSMRYIVICE